MLETILAGITCVVLVMAVFKVLNFIGVIAKDEKDASRGEATRNER